MASNLPGKELIIDGKIIDQGLTQSNMTMEMLLQQLNAMGITDIGDVTLAMIVPNGTLYVDRKKD